MTERELSDLFTQNRDHLKRMVAFRLDVRLKGRLDPSDVVQDVFVDAHKRREHFEDRVDVTALAWLRAVAAQTLADLHRRHLGTRQRSVAREAAPPWSDTTACAMGDALAASLTSPSQAALQGERSRQLHDALEGMDPIDREVLALRHFEELGNAEVAAVLGLQPTAANNRYIRALRRLRELLDTEPS